MDYEVNCFSLPPPLDSTAILSSTLLSRPLFYPPSLSSLSPSISSLLPSFPIPPPSPSLREKEKRCLHYGLAQPTSRMDEVREVKSLFQSTQREREFVDICDWGSADLAGGRAPCRELASLGGPEEPLGESLAYSCCSSPPAEGGSQVTYNMTISCGDYSCMERSEVCQRVEWAAA